MPAPVKLGTSYDEVPYESYPFQQTHPDRLATLAVLLGLEPAPVASARVLELGCAAGGNLVPLAVAYPRMECVGVDLSALQIAQGQAMVDALGLRNVRLLAASVTDIGPALGTFDYIIAHGLYSWVPDAVQEAILALCRINLDQRGVAYVSYNTLPGWHMHLMIRDLMRFHALGFSDPAKRVQQARAMLDFLAQSVPREGNPYGMLLQKDLELLRGLPDYYILHEHLEETNEPLYFHQFVERARRHGLQYLGESDFGSMLTYGFAPKVADTVRRIAPDVVRQEQLMDFLRNRTFRQTLLVHEEHRLERKIMPQRLHRLWVASLARPQRPNPDLSAGVPEQFASGSQGPMVTTANAITKAALVVLAQRWPQAVAFEELLASAHTRLNPLSRQGPLAAERATLATDLLYGFAVGLIELHAGPSPFAARAGERPVASPLARWQASAGRPVTNLRHAVLQLGETPRQLLLALDGSCDRAALLAAGAAGGDAAQLEAWLADLAGAALLVG